MNRVVKSGKKKGWVTEEEMKVMEDIFNQPSKN